MPDLVAMSPSIRTVSDRLINILWPEAAVVDINDIAHSLSLQCRYNGHVSEHYNVAHHSVIVSQHCPKEDALWGLLHDASEAYLGDVNSPLKSVLGMYKVIEKRHMNAICKAFGLPAEEPKGVWVADKEVYLAEERDLRNRTVVREGLVAYPSRIVPLSSGVSKAAFLARFDQLMSRR